MTSYESNVKSSIQPLIALGYYCCVAACKLFPPLTPLCIWKIQDLPSAMLVSIRLNAKHSCFLIPENGVIMLMSSTMSAHKLI